MTRPASEQTGLGLVELMVSLALGLFIVAVAMGLLLSQLKEQHRRLLDTRLQQELRAGLVLIEADLRRAGRWGTAEQGLWQATSSAALPANPYATAVPDSASSPTLGYTYSRDAAENQTVDTNERFGFRLHPTTRALELRTVGVALAPSAADTWQAVSDPQAVVFTELTVTPSLAVVSLGERCSQPCPTGATDCPPQQRVRLFDVTLAAQATAAASVQARMNRRIHLPTDVLQGHCPVS